MELGWPSVAWGLKNISSHEITEWMAYYRIDPFGYWRADVQTGIVASTIANANRDPKKQNQALKPDDFIINWQEQRSVDQSDKLVKQVEVINSAYGGQDKRLKDG